MSKTASSPDLIMLGRLKTFLSRGQRDYDWVASRVYAACYNDENVLQKILAADPGDAPSSDEEDYESDDEYADIDEEYDWDSGDQARLDEENESPAPTEKGSKDDPVMLEEDDEVENKSGKRKRPISKADDEAVQKKAKLSDKPVLCVNCGSKFRPNRNKEDACHYHPSETILGELELNPTSDQISDDEDSRETWPNAFQWECCEANFEDSDDPCETGPHEAQGEQTEYARRQETKRRRTKLYG